MTIDDYQWKDYHCAKISWKNLFELWKKEEVDCNAAGKEYVIYHRTWDGVANFVNRWIMAS